MEKNWYVVHTYSGFEKFVAESIRQRAIELNIEEQIGKIIIPYDARYSDICGAVQVELYLIAQYIHKFVHANWDQQRCLKTGVKQIYHAWENGFSPAQDFHW